MADAPAPTVKKLDVTIARLRILLADITAREAALDTQQRTFADQQHKLITFCLYGDSNLESGLNMLTDVEERLQHTQLQLRSLRRVRERAEEELESLQITRGIQEARSLLQQLQAQQMRVEGADGALSPDALQAEIARLQAQIHEASERAARSIELQSARNVENSGQSPTSRA
jgi:hypothetical protein